jgi:hypothetical protein
MRRIVLGILFLGLALAGFQPTNVPNGLGVGEAIRPFVNGAGVTSSLEIYCDTLNATNIVGNGSGIIGIITTDYALTANYAINIPVQPTYITTANADARYVSWNNGVIGNLNITGTITANKVVASGAITGASYSGGAITGTTISGSALQVNGNITATGTLGCGAITSSGRIKTTILGAPTAVELSSGAGMFELFQSEGYGNLMAGYNPNAPYNAWIQSSTGYGGTRDLKINELGGDVSFGGKIETTSTATDSIKTAGGVEVLGTEASSLKLSQFNQASLYDYNFKVDVAVDGRLYINSRSDETTKEGFSQQRNGDVGFAQKVEVKSTASDSIKTAGGYQTTIASDTDSDTNDVLTTTIPNTAYGLVIVRESTGTEACVFLIAGGTIEKIGADATFTVTKDNASTYNVYFETNVIKVQNKVGDNKNIAVGLYSI